MTETGNEESDRLLAKAIRQLGLKPPCTHTTSLLVQHVDDEYGWFACYQCSDCGQILRREVTASDLNCANDAPWLDIDSYQQANNQPSHDETLNRTLIFFAKAARSYG